MTKSSVRDVYAGQDPREIPAYPLFEAARYVGVPVSTLRSWLHGTRHFEPIITPANAADGQLSFLNLVEAFVVAGLRRHHKMSLQRIRTSVKRLHEFAPNLTRPLADADLVTFAREIFIEDAGAELVNMTRHPGQLGIRGILEQVSQRVEKDVSGARRLYPFTRDRIVDAPRLVMIDPRVQFGRPVIAGTGIPTAVIHERWKAGDSVRELAEDYDRTADEIEEALRYEAA
jgi:uncharacterized protein (DUF433 family)